MLIRLAVALCVRFIIITGQEEPEDELAEPWQDHCEVMDPGNRTYQTTPLPYLLTLNTHTIHCLQAVYLTLAAPPPLTYQGFMVQGRDAKTGDAVGEFDTQYRDVAVINCFGRPENTAMHKDNSTKTEVHLRWSPDSEEEMTINFFITVAEKLEPVERYWACHKTTTLYVKKSPYKTPAPPPWWENDSSEEEDSF